MFHYYGGYYVKGKGKSARSRVGSKSLNQFLMLLLRLACIILLIY